MPAAIVGVGGLIVSSVGVADAATGGNFLLGKSNKASTLTTLTNTKGTPLSLQAKSGFPPLKVNNSKLVPKLNSNFLNGLSSSQLQRRVHGGCATTGIGSIGSGGGVACSTPDQIVFTSSSTFTVPAGITHLTGELWGAGGGGGYHQGSGASGAYESVLLTVSPGQVVNVTVGAAGQGGYTGTNGGSSTLSITGVNGGSPLASAGGGGGNTFPCVYPAGGTAGQPVAPALGIQSRPGVAGDCGPAGGAGFVGYGGAPYAGNGGGGVVILSIDH